MTQFLQAHYGAKDNRHALLEFEGDPALLPLELLGLTDKPPGHSAPGDCWWPSVGCGPVGRWWALWWTVPDESTQRGGMVLSHVALWSLDEIGWVTDLRPMMKLLSGQELILPTSENLLRSVAEALVSTGADRPPVISGLDAWPELIADLWERLWPNARRNFSARVAVSPPQGGESVAPPWLFGIPSKREPEWSNHRIINVLSSHVSRAAGWLVGDTDPTLNEVLSSCNFHSVELRIFSPAARAAERLDKLRKSPDPECALKLLRSLVILAPGIDTAGDLKTEALRELGRGFSNVTASFVLSLRNLDQSSLPSGELPIHALQEWVSLQVTSLSITQASQLFAGLKLKKAEIWWQQCVYNVLSKGLANPDAHWAKAALMWLGLSDCTYFLVDILPLTENVETCILDVAPEIKMSGDMLKLLRVQVIERKWSRLHAWAVMMIFSPQVAFHEQRQFPGSPLPGLKYLVEHLPGSTVIEEFISTPNPQLIHQVAQRTILEPELLQSLDVKHSAWRVLWAEHVNAGGICWPPGVNRDVLASGLVDAVLDGDEPIGLVAMLAKDLAYITYNHPKRAELWQRLSSSGFDSLLPHVADYLIQDCNAGQIIPLPEDPLINMVANKARKTRPSAKVLGALLLWNVLPDEQELISWLSYYSGADWQPSIAVIVGTAISSRGWKHAAKKVYEKFMSGSMPELRPTVDACQNLLSWWEKTRFSWNGTGNNTNTSNGEIFVRRVAELGADFAPDGLEDIWVRAGGKSQYLSNGINPANRWQQAASLAHQGMLESGLIGLVRELKERYPYNSELLELENLLVLFEP